VLSQGDLPAPMRSPLADGMAPPMAMRHRLYAGFFAAGLLVMVGGAFWRILGRELGPANDLIHWPVLGFMLLAVLLLLWLRPRPLPYGIGLLCLLLAFAGLWLTSPFGSRWLVTAVPHEPRGAIPFLMTFLFPAAWVLLAGSVAGWKIGVISYLLATLAFLVPGAAVSYIGVPGPTTDPLWFLTIMPLIWPRLLLVMLGVFGHTFG
jgi:hypothetical protein